MLNTFYQSYGQINLRYYITIWIQNACAVVKYGKNTIKNVLL